MRGAPARPRLTGHGGPAAGEGRSRGWARLPAAAAPESGRRRAISTRHTHRGGRLAGGSSAGGGGPARAALTERLSLGGVSVRGDAPRTSVLAESGRAERRSRGPAAEWARLAAARWGLPARVRRSFADQPGTAGAVRRKAEDHATTRRGVVPNGPAPRRSAGHGPAVDPRRNGRPRGAAKSSSGGRAVVRATVRVPRTVASGAASPRPPVRPARTETGGCRLPSPGHGCTGLGLVGGGGKAGQWVGVESQWEKKSADLRGTGVYRQADD